LRYVKNIENLVSKEKWYKAVGKGSASVGLTLESLLGKQNENFEWPDYHGIELKTKYSTREDYITLFNATPDSYLFEIKRLVAMYGYPDKGMPDYKILNVGVLGNRKTKIPSGYYFKLTVNRKKEQIILNVYNQNQKLIDSNCAWSFQMIKEKLERKLSVMAFIRAERKWNALEQSVYFKYHEIKLFSLKSFDYFISALEMGKIKIIFKIGVYKNGPKKGQIYDHGTGFTVKENNLQYIFKQI